MKSNKVFSGALTMLREFLKFFWEKKLWWMVPMFIVILGLGLLIVFAQSSSVVPFIYVLF